MSMKIAALVVDHGPRDPGEFAVLLVLADRADNETWVCWPSRADLSERSRLAAATVGRKLRALERDGWISRQARFNSSSVFRVNVPRLLQAAAARETSRKLPAGFKPFPEELQAIENKGDDHCDRGSDHCDRGSDHSDRPADHSDHLNLSIIYQKPLARKVRRASPLPAVGQAARGLISGSGSAVASLSPFQRSRILSGQSVIIAGETVLPGSVAMQALAQAVRLQGAENKGGVA